ncbi:hypothetical protein PVAND_013431 [Polypedilum vanderplanki]|uniref:Uncharacterized protein n=1 Tax=Polypedilum vanderplanki TaxID=319348 RepID=A0A9J6CQP0_POLVA|nr:hypothetical protein PVAND_013431 [Polypedilum vanderplanki]
MSSRGFLLRMHDDDSLEPIERRPLSPNIIISRQDYFTAREGDSESPAMSLTGGQNGQIPKSPEIEEPELSNQISAAYEVPQFPIEQIEKKLLLQRHLTAK